ncbi:MAG: aldo/keto reductase [Planctomycetota bacterium]
MRFRRLGRSGIEVSTVALGLWSIVRDQTWGPDQSERDSVAAIQAALECGITFFDTAEAYGAGYSEAILGKTLGARRKEVILATKASPSHQSAEALVAACERSLKRLRTDHIDLYILHWPSRQTPIEETMGAMEGLIRSGKVRAAGVSNFGAEDLSKVLRHGRVEANQLGYNLLFRAIEHELAAACAANDVSITCYCPLAQGLLTGKYLSEDTFPEGRARTRHFSSQRKLSRHGEKGAEEETFLALAEVRRIAREAGEPMGRMSLAWLLAQKGITSVIAGARNAEQVRENAAAAEVDLGQATIQALARATDALKEKLGPNPDLWESPSRIR